MEAFNSFKYYRELLGLSQEELAMYLQVNRNTLAKVENNQRELPTSTYLKLMELALHHPENNKVEKYTSLDDFFGAELATEIQKAIKEKEWQLQHAKNKHLQVCEKLRLQTQRKETYEQVLQNLKTDDPQLTQKQNFIEIQLNEINKDLTTPYQIEILEIVSKIKGLEAEIEFLSTFLSSHI